jgi:hypothetical protein
MGEELGGERRVWYFEARLRRERLWCMRVEMNVHRGKVVESACGSHTEIPKFDCLIDAVYTPYHA